MVVTDELYILKKSTIHAFKTHCSAKTFSGWLPSNIFAEWLCFMCHTWTWMSSWSDVILIWYHYIVTCTLLIIFNWWLSSKDMKLRVLIKEALVVFHWLMSHIILLYSLASGHRALFWYKRQLNYYYYYYYNNNNNNYYYYYYYYYYVYIYYIYIYIYI